MGDSWKSVQMRTFTKWVNAKLNSSISDLPEALSDGVLLCKLYGKLTSSDFKCLHELPQSRIQRFENVQKVLVAVKSSGVKLINIGSADIVDKNEKLVLGLLWALILKFSILKSSSNDKGLLAWAKAACGRSVKIEDFSKSWADGRAFCAVLQRFANDDTKSQLTAHIHHSKPKKASDNDYTDELNTNLHNSTGFDDIDHKNRSLDALEFAFVTAESLGVPRLLDPSDVAVDRPDEKSIMTYVSALHDRFKDSTPRYTTLIENGLSMRQDAIETLKMEHEALLEAKKDIETVNHQIANICNILKMLLCSRNDSEMMLNENKIKTAGAIGTLHSIEAVLQINKTNVEDVERDFDTNVPKLNLCEKCLQDITKHNSILIDCDKFNSQNIQSDLPQNINSMQNVQSDKMDVASCMKSNILNNNSSGLLDVTYSSIPHTHLVESNSDISTSQANESDFDKVYDIQAIKTSLKEDISSKKPSIDYDETHYSDDVSKIDRISYNKKTNILMPNMDTISTCSSISETKNDVDLEINSLMDQISAVFNEINKSKNSKSKFDFDSPSEYPKNINVDISNKQKNHDYLYTKNEQQSIIELPTDLFESLKSAETSTIEIEEQIKKCQSNYFRKELIKKKFQIKLLKEMQLSNLIINEANQMFETIDQNKSGRILKQEAESIFSILGLKMKTNMETEIIKNERTNSFAEYIAKTTFDNEIVKRLEYASSREGILSRIQELRESGEEVYKEDISNLESILNRIPSI